MYIDDLSMALAAAAWSFLTSIMDVLIEFS